MIKTTALEISKRLSIMCVEQIIGSGTACTIRAMEIRNHIPQKFDIEHKKVILSRTIELLSLTFDIPYETETLLLILDINILQCLLTEIKKSIKFLEELGNVELESYESDNDFFLNYALYSLDNYSLGNVIQHPQ